MSELLRPYELPKLDTPPDYADFCFELNVKALVLADRNKYLLHELQSQTVSLLNHTFDVRGEAIIQSEIAYEIVIAPPNLERNPRRGEKRIACYEIANHRFKLAGYCLGFAENPHLPSREVSLVFADDEDPFLRGQTPPFDKAAVVHRSYFVPISSPHELSVVNGLRLAA